MRPILHLLIAHLIANAILLYDAYLWLGISDSRNVTIAASAIAALLLLAATAITYGATLAFFTLEKDRGVSQAWKTAIRHALPLTTATLAIAAIYWLLSLWPDYSTTPAFTIASFLTMIVRKPIAPATINKIFDAILFAIRWAILPALLLPILSSISIHGTKGLKIRLHRWWYWLATPSLLLMALWIPLKILDWKPHLPTFSEEMTSFLLRATFAYLLFAAVWLALAFATSAGNPRLAQSNTAASP